MNMQKIKNVGIISTRIAGTDGVSLEIEKWVEVLKRNRFDCFYFAGEVDRDEEIIKAIYSRVEECREHIQRRVDETGISSFI